MKSRPVEHSTYSIKTLYGKTFIIESGSKILPPLLLLHGSAGNSAAWLGDIQELSSFFHVYALDIPGEPGNSTERRLCISKNEPALWLDDVIRQIAPGKTTIAGLSLGGWYALHYAHLYQEKVSGLTLISSGGIAPTRKSFLFKALLYMCMGKRGMKKLNRLIFYSEPIPEEYTEYSEMIARYFIPMTEAIPVLTESDIHKFTFPIQYIGGEHDALIHTKKSAERLRKIKPESDIHLFADKGHVISGQADLIARFHNL